ncbi:tetratricopeptide repeat protein [Nonomuraea sp. NPDC050310]|uniref:tetratricopeptide repeat protein n=1 Tax=unclassified Nonomuraea TaxID=2593643 RepID=UPI0034020A23
MTTPFLQDAAARLDADRRIGGPYTLGAALIGLLLPAASPDLVAAHDIELRVAAPNLAERVPVRRRSRADSLPSAQRILIPGARRTLRIANGLAEFCRDALAGRELTVTVDNLAEADQTDRELIEVLRRRVPALRLVEGAHTSAGGPLREDFDRYRDEGFHHAMAEAGPPALARLTPGEEEWWTLLHRTAGALEAIEREDEAWELYQLARREGVDPKHRATVACSMATLLVRHHDPARRDATEALAWVNEAIAITSLLPDPAERAFHLGFDLNTRALVEVRLRRFEAAARLVAEAIDLAERHLAGTHPIHLLVLYGNRALLSGGEAALADYTRAIELDPGYPDYYLDRGNLLAKLGRTEEALADYESAMRLSPPFPEPYYNRSELRFAAGDHAGALADLDYVLELDPGFAPAYVNRAGLLVALGEYGGAARDVAKGLELDPANAHLHAVRGQVEAIEGRTEAARAAYDAALGLQPDLVAAWANRGELAYLGGEFEAAVADLTQAVKLAESAELLFNRAVALRACGRHQEAREDLLRAAELAPDDPDVRQALAED